MYLPGTINERIGDLRTSKGFQQKELAEMIGVSASQLSRIENGETTNINAETIAKLARALNVSTDYILGLTTISVPKSYDINELGLSESAVKNLLIIKSYGATPILNLLLEHKRFPALVTQIKAYFYDEIAQGVLGINRMFELATTSLGDLRKEQPEKSADIRDGVRFINAEKNGLQGMDIEKIKNTFISILRDIKKELDGGELQGTIAPADVMQQIQEQLQLEMSEPPSAEAVAAGLTEVIGQMIPLDGEITDLFNQLAKGVMEKMTEDTQKP